MSAIKDEWASGDGSVRLLLGDCLEILPTLGEVDAVVTDPPYELGFMGKSWDSSGIAFRVETWEAALRCLKPGGYMLCFGGSRTYHRIACAVEDAGFEIRDCILWIYGTGFPKGQGCLKPAYEPIILARKPGKGVLPLGIDECRVPTGDKLGGGHCSAGQQMSGGWRRPWMDDPEMVEANAARSREAVAKAESLGRYPANVAHDGSDEVLEAFAAFGESKSSGTRRAGGKRGSDVAFGQDAYTQSYERTEWNGPADQGTAARFFYCAKASKSERGEGNTHPTVKPLALIRWLVRLACPQGGCVLDPFAGSGTTLIAARQEGRNATGVELKDDHYEIAKTRLQSKDEIESVAPEEKTSLKQSSMFDPKV